MSAKPILIAGGGIAGLATGLGLARAGRDVRLFEQAEAFAEVGAGLQMSPNAVRALQRLGAWAHVEPHCVIPTEIHVRDGLTGNRLQRIRLGKAFEDRFGAPYRVAHRADLLKGLLAAATSSANIILTTGAKAVSAHNTGSGAELIMASGQIQSGAAVIAADGIRSALRAAVHPTANVIDHRHIFYRTLLPIERVPTSASVDTVTLWLLPGAHVVHYAVSNWQQFNVIAVVEGKAAESDWAAPATSGEVRQAFRSATDTLQDIVTVPEQWFKWRAADIDPLPASCDRQIALVGDAAHATLPYLAQGAAMSLEDAAVLAHAMSKSADVADALASYEAHRQQRTSHIQLESRRQGETYHARGLLRLARNTALRLMPESAFLQRLAWIYSWTPPD